MFGMMAKHAAGSVDFDKAVGQAEAEKKWSPGTRDPYDPPILKAGHDAYDSSDTATDYAPGGSFCKRLLAAATAQKVDIQWIGKGGDQVKTLSG